MKFLVENWRNFISEQRELIQEFRESDKEALLAAGERFTVSYEIELLSEQEALSGDPDRPSLQEYAESFLSFDYFSETGWERGFDDFMAYNFLDDYSSDANGLLEKYVSENVLAVSPQAENVQNDISIAKFEIAIGHGRTVGADAKSVYEGIISDISRDDTVASSRFIELLLNTPGIKEELEQYSEVKATQANLDLDDFDGVDTIIHVLSGVDNVELFKRYVFDLEGSDPGFPDQARGLGNMVALEDFFGALMLDVEFDEIMTEVEEFIEHEIVDAGERWATMYDGYYLDQQRELIDTKSSHLKEIVRIVSAASEKYVEDQAQEEWELFREDPVDYLEGMGHELQYHYEEQYGPVDEYGTGGYDEGSMYELMFQHLPNFMNKYSGDIKLEEDASLSPDPHVEFSMDSPPYITGLEAALEYLETFFKDFENQDNFSMSGRTGLHTNVGILDEDDSPIGDYNFMKALLFLNHEFATKGFETRARSQWAGDLKEAAIEKIRKLIGDQLAREEVIDSEDDAHWSKETVLNNFVKKEFDKVENDLSHVVAQAASYAGSKSIGFNITYVGSRKYVEFRYPGHANLNFDNMRNATLYYAHVIKLSTDPQYKREEYMRKLIGFLNNLQHVERTKLKGIDEIKKLKKGTLLASSIARHKLHNLYIYLTSEAEREAGRDEDLGRGSELIKMRELDQEFLIFKGINAKNKAVVVEEIVMSGDNFIVKTLEKPMNFFEIQLEKGNLRVIPDPAYSSPAPLALSKLIMAMFETVREAQSTSPITIEEVMSRAEGAENIQALRDRIYSIRYSIRREWDWKVTDEDRDLVKKYEGIDPPKFVPTNRQLELRQQLRRYRAPDEEETPESASSVAPGIWDQARARARSDEESYIRNRERPRLPPISGGSGPVPYEMGYNTTIDEDEEESLKIMKQQRKFVKDGVITIPKSNGGPWSGTIEQFERFWRLGAQRASGESEPSFRRDLKQRTTTQ